MKKNYSLFLFFVIAVLFISAPVLAKKKKQTLSNSQLQSATTAVSQRIAHLSADDKRKFDDLSKEQQESMKQGKIEKGFNAWMVKLALGEPYYGTEHHPIFTDYEEVWLYTKPEITNDVKEERIIDLQTNWPTLHRTTRKKTCAIGDFFVLWDRGIVENVHPANDKKVYGSCTIQTEEAFLPIVDGKPVEPKK